ncbi:MAG: transcription antitermination protein NusB [Lachnospirales bacterium]
MGISRKTARQHIFNIVFQFKYFDEIEINIEELMNKYFETLEIRKKAVGTPEVDLSSEDEVEFIEEEEFEEEVEIIEELEETRVPRNDPEDFVGIKRSEISDSDYSFIYRYVSGTYQNLKEIDKFIEKNAKQGVRSVSPEPLAIIRIAIYELLYAKETSQKIVINEAIELAKLFCGENLYKFVNGILGKILKEINGEVEVTKENKNSEAKNEDVK